MGKPDRRRSARRSSPDRREIDCRHCGIPVVVVRDPGMIRGFAIQDHYGQLHPCPERPAYKQQELLNRSRRLLANGKMTPSQRRELRELIRTLEGGAM